MAALGTEIDRRTLQRVRLRTYSLGMSKTTHGAPSATTTAIMIVTSVVFPVVATVAFAAACAMGAFL